MKIFSHSLPWGQSTLVGYFFKICFDICAGEACLFPIGAIIILFFSMSLHHRTFCQIFRNEVKELDSINKTHDVAEHLQKLIRFHISAKK